jgi:hypothetical protein
MRLEFGHFFPAAWETSGGADKRAFADADIGSAMRCALVDLIVDHAPEFGEKIGRKGNVKTLEDSSHGRAR